MKLQLSGFKELFKIWWSFEMIRFIWRFEPCLFTLEPNISGGLKYFGVMEGPRFQDHVILFFIQRFVKDSDPTITTKETFHLSSAIGNPLEMLQ